MKNSITYIFILLFFNISCIHISVLHQKPKWFSKYFFLKNTTNDTLIFSYYSFTTYNIYLDPNHTDSCVKHIGNNVFQYLFDSLNLSKRNSNIIFNRCQNNYVEIKVPPHNTPICFGQKGPDGMDFDLIIGEGKISIRNKQLNFIDILNNRKFEKMAKLKMLIIDSSILQMPNNPTIFFKSNLSIYTIVGNNTVMERVGSKNKIWWVSYYNQGRIDSLCHSKKMITKKCN